MGREGVEEQTLLNFFEQQQDEDVLRIHEYVTEQGGGLGELDLSDRGDGGWSVSEHNASEAEQGSASGL